MVRTVGVIRVGNGDRVLFMCQIGPIFPGFHIHTFVVPIIFWGRGGRIWFLCVAWKAATRVEFWKAGLNWAMAVLGRTKADIMRWEAAGAWLSRADRELYRHKARARGEEGPPER